MPAVLISPEVFLHQEGPHTTILREAGLEVRYPRDPLLARGLGGEEQTIRELQGISAIIAGGELFNAGALAGLPQLRVIARAGVGFDRVDVPAATRRGVALTITPTANHEAVAEHTIALMFAVAKNIVVNDKHTRAGGWARTMAFPIRRQTLGIVGLGRIGRSLAVRGVGLSMTVKVCETQPDMAFLQKHGIELLPLDALLAQSDYVSVNCPLNDATRGLCNAAFFARMKKGSVFLNTSRGGVQVEKDLLAALTSGHLRGAGLDVFEVEPISQDNPLFALDNVVVSQHLAGSDTLSTEAMAVECAECIVALYQGQWPDGKVVNDELRGKWQW